MPTEEKDLMSKKSTYREVLLRATLDPENWDDTLSELGEKAHKLLKGKKKHGKKIPPPSYSTVQRVMNHPDFKKEVRERRQVALKAAMPAIEKALVRKIIEEGDVRAYDRIIRAVGEDMSPINKFDIDVQVGAPTRRRPLNEGEIDRALERMAKARKTKKTDDK